MSQSGTIASSLNAPAAATASEVEAPSRTLRQWLPELAVGVFAFLTALTTYLVLSGDGPVEASPGVVGILLVVNVLMAIVLIGAIWLRLYNLSRARESGVAGAQLHVRLVMAFAIITIIPTVVVAIFSAVMLNLGIDSWFSDRVKTAIHSAAELAEAYVIEQNRSMEADVMAVAADMNRELFLAMSNPPAFREYLFRQISLRRLSVAAIYDGSGRNIDGVRNTYLVDLGEAPPIEDFRQAREGRIVIRADPEADRIQALVKLEGYTDWYLLAVRYVDSQVLQNQKQAIDAQREYALLETNRTSVQLTFAAVYGVVGLLMLLTAVSVGFNAANRLVGPIGRLIGASERVSAGDLSARVETKDVTGELAVLSGAFNKMTGDLQRQREELMEAHRIAEDRRIFAEAVLSGVSAGVIGLDAHGRVDVANPPAAPFLGVEHDDLIGREIEDVASEISGLLAEARSNPDGRASGQFDFVRNGRMRNLSVRVSSASTDDARTDFVITFDDMTDLLAAQRSAAWGDVARRIAHEITNPLTPIQLSAERIRRKYAKEIVSDPDIFEKCTQTIIRQVGDIGRMVDEFSSFARMPKAIMREEDAGELVRQAVFLQSVGNPSIDFKLNAPDEAIPLVCDAGLVTQALTNILKNASEAVAARFEPEPVDGVEQPRPEGRGLVAVNVEVCEHAVTVNVVDNGVGLPTVDRQRLTEPYVTTRRKGTGLGLAIVKKILEEHGGSLQLGDDEIVGGGAQVTLSFPRLKTPDSSQDGSHEQSAQLA